MRYYKIIKHCLFSLSLVLLGTSFAACEDNIKLDANGNYDNVEGVYGAVRNVTGARDLSTITVFGSSTAGGQLYFELTEAATEAVSMQLKVDEKALEAYNAAHGTSFKMYPEAQVTLANNGVVNIAAGTKKSEIVDVIVSSNGENGTTYALPISAEIVKGGVAVSKANQSYIYLVQPYPAIPSSDKGTGIKAICYIEVNDENLLNVGEYTMAGSGKPFFDVVNLFAANINYNCETKRVYVNCNDNVSYILKNADKFIRPLQTKGIRVCLTILGNHDEAGIANLSPEAAADFACELKAYVDVYGLDGIDFDDEYSKYNPTNPGPGFVAPSGAAVARLVYECRKIMPDKIISVYDFSRYIPSGSVEGKEVGTLIDYSYWGAYAGWLDRSGAITGLGKMKYGPSSFNLNFSADNGGYSLSDAQRARNEGYGIQMFYNLKANYDYSTGLNKIGNILFDDDVKWTGKTFQKTSFSGDDFKPSYASYIGTWKLKPSQGLFYYISEDGKSRLWDWTDRVTFTLRIEEHEAGKSYKVYGWGETGDDLPFIMNYNKAGRVEINLPQTVTDSEGKKWQYTAKTSYQTGYQNFVMKNIESVFNGYLNRNGVFSMNAVRYIYNDPKIKTMTPAQFNGSTVLDVYGGQLQDVAYEPYTMSE